MATVAPRWLKTDMAKAFMRAYRRTRHVEITLAAYEKTLDVFEYNGLVKQRYRYEQVCAAPPVSD